MVAGNLGVILPFLWAKFVTAAFPDCSSGPLAVNDVCNESLDAVSRAKALIGQLTIEEKIKNTGSTSPGVPRLGLPPYEWWQEALHGVASSPGVRFSENGEFSAATSFPQPILLGAAFDDALIKSVATVVSTEARAFSNADRSGLDFWTPNINPFKDPRWGRGQETPGEDPFHLGSYVKSLIAGLEGGSESKYKRVVATCKHFVGYDMEDWNGNFRYQWDAQISMQDMVEYYMPPFRACARDSKVGAFMCSYNAVNGVPTCADSWLLDDVLRKHWDWDTEQEWVTSDCDSVQNIYLPHRWAETREGAAAAALLAGTDIDCGTYYQDNLPAAYAQGLIKEDDVDKALVRQYSSLIRLGYFDSPTTQQYRSLNFSHVDTPEARKLAHRAAVEGIVLLKNDGTLPLDLKTNRSVALIGDWANATIQMQGNYRGQAPYLHSPLYAAQQLTKVYYAQGISGQNDPTTGAWPLAWAAASQADVIIYVGGIDNEIESEGHDRVSLEWTGAQLDMIEKLSSFGKPMVVVQMGGGQLDSSPIASNPNIGALLWAGYPGQDGGTAIFDIITGKSAPAGRLPVTQYPADYASKVPMTDMTLRPSSQSPGRTYRWYSGKAVFPFGHGLHYTSFTPSLKQSNDQAVQLGGSSRSIAELVSSCKSLPHGTKYLDLCPFETFEITVENTGKTTSDYVVLLFLAGEFGPRPYPLKTLAAYERLHDIAGQTSKAAQISLTLGSLARTDEDGNTVLYPGDYSLQLDIQPLRVLNFSLTGEPVVLDYWPQPPPDREVPNATKGYFAGEPGVEFKKEAQKHLSW